MPRMPSTPTRPRPRSARIRRPCAPATPCTSPARSRSTRPPANWWRATSQAQARRAFDNLRAVCEAAGGSLDQVVRLGLYLTDLADFAAVNAVMAEYFDAPYPGALDHRGVGIAARPPRSKSTRCSSWDDTAHGAGRSGMTSGT